MFEDFGMKLLNKDPALRSTLFSRSSEQKDLVANSRNLLGMDVAVQPRILEIARTCVQDTGKMHLTYRERYLLEILGCWICTAAEIATPLSKRKPFNIMR